MNKFDVLFTADNKYIDIMLASIYSFLQNSKLKNIRAHIITKGFSNQDLKRVESFINMFNVECYFYPLEDFNIDKYNIPKWRDGQISNSRLFFQEILKPHISNIKKVLYLDCDTITVSDLSDLKEYKKGLMACRDICCFNHYYKNLYNLDSYFNSGVLFIDVEEWIKNNYQEKIINFIENSDIELSYPDQDILNCSLFEYIEELPIKYNLPPHVYMFNDFFGKLYFNNKHRNVCYEEVLESKNKPKIIHSYGLSGIKPWNGEFNPYYNEYIKYILEVNPNFKSEELSKLKKLLSKFPTLYRGMLLTRTYIPEKLEKHVKELALIGQHSKK